MFQIEDIAKASLLVEKDGFIKLLSGELAELQSFAELEDMQNQHHQQIVFVIPFAAARENGMKTLGDETILTIKVQKQQAINPADIDTLTREQEIDLESNFEPLISDTDFAAEVSRIQSEEIAAGNACQVIYSRKFEARFNAFSPMVPLVLFARLLKQQGQFLTFLFSDGRGNYFVGASPERQLEIHDEQVIKNPISGTLPKGDRSDFSERLKDFLQDQKEINELSQILDEELKIMSQICPRGGKITGPFLRETGAVIHTEYNLVGHSKKPAVKALRISLHAPTLVGSPLESAFRIIANREKESRRYYGGEIGILEKNGDMYSAIMIRTAEIFQDGRIVIQAGAGIVRDSDPLKEALETQAKAAGLIHALTGETGDTDQYLSDEDAQQLDELLKERNQTFSKFHLEDQIGHRDLSNLHQESITIINNEDNFAHVLSHITRYLGFETSIVDTFDYDVSNDVSDLVVLGPGPGDINDDDNPRMQRLLQITSELAHRNIPTLGICLGIQAMAKVMGMPVVRQDVPTQGLQKEIDLFGKKELVGLYNSFSPVAENVPDNFEISVNEENRIMALRSENIYGVQFHLESAMTQNGLDILTTALTALMGVRERRMLSFESFVEKSISGKLNLEAQKQFLRELNQRGYSGNDIADLVRVFYKQMPSQLSLPEAIDLCGTGGSGLARINTSTLSAIIVAACGVPVAKHGNKAASGRFGSFDLLESLGLNIMAGKPRLESLYEELGLAFIFARSFHPVFKHFAQVRQELKTKTIFNLLGPLLNPANPQYQIIGTSSQEDMKLMVEAARALGKKKVLVLNGLDGLDELTLSGETAVMELKDGRIQSYTLRSEDFGFEAVTFDDIAGGDAIFNTQISEDILSGKCRTSHMDLVLANTALALKFMGKVDTYPDGVEMARKTIDQGLALKLLKRYSQLSHTPDILLEITANKRLEVEALKKHLPLDKIKSGLKKSDRNFKAAISASSELQLIAEIKRSSPSEKVIYEGEFNVGKIAATYEQNGVDAISVLTDKKYFQGDLEYIKEAREATRNVPLLMKDFFIDEYQIYLARYYGADAILLITAILTPEQISSYASLAKFLSMDVLLETHTKTELEIAINSQAQIIGINNRDLHDFIIDKRTFLKLFHLIPRDRIIVAESGYTSENANAVQGMANAVLIGTSIMKSENMTEEILKFKKPQKKVKACGIRTKAAAVYCEENKIPFVGLNFVPTSKRVVDLETAKMLRSNLKNSASVGVFMDQEIDEVNSIAEELDLDFVQLAGSEGVDYCKKIDHPLIKTLNSGNIDQMDAYATVVEMFIFDGAIPGSGKTYDYSALKGIKSERPFLVAGGIQPENAKSVLLLLPNAMGLDVASGIETDGEVDLKKIESIARQVAGA